MDAYHDFKELLSTLNAFRVKYLVVGAHAVMHYTEPRYTKDLDIWIESTAVNAQAAWNALAKFGAPLKDVTPADFQNPEIIYQIGIEPIRIDVMSAISGVQFKTAWRNAVKGNYAGQPIRIIGLKDLLRSKRAAARPQDLLDIASLTARKKKRRS
jgi:hypothetical protein